MTKDSIQNEIEQIRKEIEGNYKAISFCMEAEERTIKMYPPDGGGHGHKWRTEIEGHRRTIRELEDKIVTLNNNSEEIYKDDEFEKTCRLIVPDFRQINLELIEYFSNNPHKLQNLEWREFEELLESIFRNQGFRTELGPGRGDGGVDLRLLQKDSVGELVTLVQAKKYKHENSIRLEAVQALFGVVEDQKANRGLFVTTSRYLPSAEKFAISQKHRLTLANSNDVAKWCKLISKSKQNI